MPQWEYDVVIRKESFEEQEEINFLNEKGRDNWEAFRIVRYAQTHLKFYFKRPLILSPGGKNMSSYIMGTAVINDPT